MYTSQKMKKNHRQVIQSHYLPALSGEERIDGIPEPALPFNSRKLILRRAAQFLTYGDTISIGYGINNELSNLLHEECVEHDDCATDSRCWHFRWIRWES